MNSMGEHIVVYCILDRDYHTEQEIEDRYQKAEDRGISLCIWSQKEIENYLLRPSVVHRYILNHIAKRTTPPSLEEVEDKIESLAWAMEEAVFDTLSNEFLARNRETGSIGSNQYAREYMKPYKQKGSLLPIVSGKSLLAELSSWSQSEFSVQINSIGLIREFRRSEVHSDIEHVITAIERLHEF